MISAFSLLKNTPAWKKYTSAGSGTTVVTNIGYDWTLSYVVHYCIWSSLWTRCQALRRRSTRLWWGSSGQIGFVACFVVADKDILSSLQSPLWKNQIVWFPTVSQPYFPTNEQEVHLCSQWKVCSGPMRSFCTVVISFHFLLHRSKFYWSFGLVFDSGNTAGGNSWCPCDDYDGTFSLLWGSFGK